MDPNDPAAELPGMGTLVHRDCYTETVGTAPPLRLTLRDYLRNLAA